MRSGTAPGHRGEGGRLGERRREEEGKVGRHFEQQGCCHPADVTLTVTPTTPQTA